MLVYRQAWQEDEAKCQFLKTHLKSTKVKLKLLHMYLNITGSKFNDENREIMQSEFPFTFGHNINVIAEDNLLLHQLKHKDLHVAQLEPDI